MEQDTLAGRTVGAQESVKLHLCHENGSRWTQLSVQPQDVEESAGKRRRACDRNARAPCHCWWQSICLWVNRLWEMHSAAGSNTADGINKRGTYLVSMSILHNIMHVPTIMYQAPIHPSVDCSLQKIESICGLLKHLVPRHILFSQAVASCCYTSAQKRQKSLKGNLDKMCPKVYKMCGFVIGQHDNIPPSTYQFVWFCFASKYF